VTQMSKNSESAYVIVTAAHNEEAFLELTIQSVLAQTLRPVRWVIVSDRSTDRTDSIVESYAAQHEFIRLLRLDHNLSRGSTSKITALREAIGQLGDCEYDFIANLDGDVSFDTDYFVSLLTQFQQDPGLGIAGGVVYEPRKGVFRPRISNALRSVAHAGQMVRRTCYDQIGGWLALEFGGEDWYAEIRARKFGWRVAAFPEQKLLHYRPTGGATPLFLHRFREGKMDQSVGSHPAFEIAKCARRVLERPFLLGSLVRMGGFLSSHATRRPPVISPELVRFLRKEQIRRILDLIHQPARYFSPLKIGSGKEMKDRYDVCNEHHGSR
jgi:poly-beta-1,6-N-acetyl-D-glucosamine synthase